MAIPIVGRAIKATRPPATVQTCVVHLVRSSLRYASKADWGKTTAELRAVYTAATVPAAEARFAEFAGSWPRTLPHRTVGHEDPLPHRPGKEAEPLEPHRQDQRLEEHPEHIRHYLRRPTQHQLAGKNQTGPPGVPHAGAPLDYTQVAARACPGTSDRRPHPAVFLWLLSPLPAPHGKARPRCL